MRASGGPLSVGAGKLKSSPLLFGRFKNARLRNRGAAWLALAGQRSGAHGRRIADYKDRQGLQRAGDAGIGGREAREILWGAGDRMFAHCRWREAQSRAL